ncbi:MAG: OmpA family protein [Candidatus Omnitrophota bacterium]
MRKMLILLVVSALFITGCAVKIYKKSPKDKARIEELSGEVERLGELRAEEKKQFEEMKRELQRQLRGEKVGLDVADRGLVITLANNILFDSGKAKIKPEAYPILDKIMAVIKTKAADKEIGIEGHTDNVPIKYSSWKSNRELSTARANDVYHYLVKVGNIDPARLATMGYGEFRPIGNNKTAAGRAKNRRVEIVILPQYPKKGLEELEAENWAK